MKGVLAICIVILGLNFVVGYDPDELDDQTGCPKVFKKNDKRGLCKCGTQRYHVGSFQKEDAFVVNCTNTRFTSTEMLEYLPDETEVLLFNGNDIPYMRQNVLGIDKEHENLKVLDFSNNNITEIAGKAFHYVSKVEILILNHNNIRISGDESHPRLLTNFENLKELYLTNAFTEVVDSKYYLEDLSEILFTAGAEGVQNLMKLDLAQNEIWTVSDKIFCSDTVPSLTRLILSNNQLHDLDLEFECMEKLEFLDVSYNKIKRLDKHTLARIENFFVQPPESLRKTPNTTRKINMVDNPYLCDCNLRDMYNWLRDTRANLYSREEMRCYNGVPELNAGRRILNVETLRCKADQDEHASGGPTDPSQHVGSGITHTLLIILIILVICLLGTLLYLNKEHVHNNVKPLIDNFQKSLQYRTIEKDLTESQIHPPEVNV